MPLNSEEIFFRLMEVFKANSLKDLSIKLGYTENWATTTRKRKKIPLDACLRASEEFNVSIDYLIYGESKSYKKIDINDLKISVTEGIFSAIQTNMITLNKDVKISQITDVITSEITENTDINFDSQKKVK